MRLPGGGPGERSVQVVGSSRGVVENEPIVDHPVISPADASELVNRLAGNGSGVRAADVDCVVESAAGRNRRGARGVRYWLCASPGGYGTLGPGGGHGSTR
jgi:hypothetical protein